MSPTRLGLWKFLALLPGYPIAQIKRRSQVPNSLVGQGATGSGHCDEAKPQEILIDFDKVSSIADAKRSTQSLFGHSPKPFQDAQEIHGLGI